MKHLACFVILLALSSCTQGGGSSLADSIKDVLNPDPSLSTAENQINQIQKNINQDATYALTNDDVAELKSEGLLQDESEIKAWLK